MGTTTAPQALDSDTAARSKALTTALELIGKQTTLSLWPYAVKSGIQAAYNVPLLTGDPGGVTDLANTLNQASQVYQQVSDDMNAVQKDKLPAVWRGDAAQTAARALVTFASDAANGAYALGDVAQQLSGWSTTLAAAMKKDQNAHADLHGYLVQATIVAGLPATGVGAELSALVDHATNSCQQRIDALTSLLSNSPSVAGRISLDVEESAPAHLMTNVDPITAELLGYTGTANAWGISILDTFQMQAASTALSRMSSGDRQEFMDMLSNSKSSQEKSYLVEYLANYVTKNDSEAATSPLPTTSQLKSYDSYIQPHGSDLKWLAQNAGTDPNYVDPSKVQAV